jgi:phage terminase large subunit-like protein
MRALVCGPTPLVGTEYSHIAIVAETAADARDVCVEGESGILSVHPKDFRPLYEPSKRRPTWPNGARAGRADRQSAHIRLAFPAPCRSNEGKESALLER